MTYILQTIAYDVLYAVFDAAGNVLSRVLGDDERESLRREVQQLRAELERSRIIDNARARTLREAEALNNRRSWS